MASVGAFSTLARVSTSFHLLVYLAPGLTPGPSTGIWHFGPIGLRRS